MADPVLLLRLEGPLQSWGTRSRWDVRDTGPDPSKSGVIGLLGCALGLKRGEKELEMLDRELRFGLRVDRPGTVGKDYHTITGYHRTADGGFRHRGEGGTARSLPSAMKHGEYTVVSTREYLEDACFLIALGCADPSVLVSVVGEVDARGDLYDLMHPRWPLYLGRKSCVPTRPVLDRLTYDYESLEDALQAEPWAGYRRGEEEPSALEGWVEDPGGSVERQDAYRVHPSRFYGFTRYRRVVIETASLRRIP